jgi:hypothetical protein
MILAVPMTESKLDNKREKKKKRIPGTRKKEKIGRIPPTWRCLT